MPSVEMLARIKELEAENKQLKKDLEHARSYKHTIKMRNRNLHTENERLKGEKEELKNSCSYQVYGDMCKEREKLRKENAKLSCLALHLFINHSYHEYKDWGRIRDGLPESKIKARSVRNADRWCRINKRCYEAYRKAKKALMEGK